MPRGTKPTTYERQKIDTWANQAEAIAKGGSSISDYVDADGRKGFFQIEHRVYQRTGEACVTCGEPIRRILVAQRGTHFCRKCQRR